VSNFGRSRRRLLILPQLTGLSFEASSILRRPCPQIQLDRHQVELTRNAALGKLKFCLSSFRAYPAGAKEARRHTVPTERAHGSVSAQPALLSCQAVTASPRTPPVNHSLHFPIPMHYLQIVLHSCSETMERITARSCGYHVRVESST
jgi:hypothetical protein